MISVSQSQRFNAIDAVRGFCLLNIFVNHMPVGVLQLASVSNLGFSDSAEIFVFLAGVSMFLAYGRQDFSGIVASLWRRAAKLYRVNLLILAVSLICLLILADVLGARNMLDEQLLTTFAAKDPLTVAWHVLTLQQSIGYSTVLRLYIALSILAPALIWLAARRWWWPLPLAVAIWGLAGQFHLVAHDSLTGAPLNLTILPWILIFTCGVAFGAGLRQGVPAPKSPLLLGMALTLVVGYLALLYVLPFWPAGQAWVADRNAHFWLGDSKMYQSPLRVLHALSVAYILVAYRDAPVLRLLHKIGPGNLLVRLGRRSLPVFTVGVLLAVPATELIYAVNRTFGRGSPCAIALEIAFVGLGVAAMTLVADRRWPFGLGDMTARSVRTAPAAMEGAAGA